MNPEGDLVVVAVTYNSAADVEGFLASIPDRAAGCTVRVVVADNASRDGTVGELRRSRRPLEVVALAANHGYAAGINAALDRAGPAVAYVIANPDIRLDPGALDAMLTTSCEPCVGIVVPRLHDDHGRLQPSLRRDPRVRRALAEALLGGDRAARLGVGEVVTAPAAYRRPRDADWATGALLLITAACLERVGPWDSSFFLYSEETDFMLRAREAGFRVRFTPTASARHRGGAAHRDPELWTLLTANRVRLFARRNPRTLAWLFWSVILLNESLRAPRSRPHRRAARELLRSRGRLLAPEGAG